MNNRILSSRVSTILAAAALGIGGATLLAEPPGKPDAPAAQNGAEAGKPEAKSEPTVVKRGSIDAIVELDGYFEAVDPFEVRVRPEAYQGDLKVLSAAAQGSAVRKGDVLLQLDADQLNKQLASAENELTAAKANLTKAQADQQLGQDADALALKMAERQLADAEGALKWFESVDGKQMLQGAELATKRMKDGADDQQDEVNELKKMYKSEELTSATADIVVKRALRQLENARIGVGMQQEREEKTKQFDYDVTRQKIAFNVDNEKQQLASLKVQQEQSKVLRGTALFGAQSAFDKAQDRVNDLKKDLADFTIKAPADGVVLYGSFTGGQWQSSSPRALRVGEKVQPGQVLMTLVTPGAVQVVVDVPEGKVGWLKSGMTARVLPLVAPDAATDGTIKSIAPVASQREQGGGYSTAISLGKSDARLLPGQRCAVRISAGSAKDALVVPVGAVSKGRVKVSDDGKEVWKDVVVGFSDGEMIEIKSGLAEGDKIITKARQ